MHRPRVSQFKFFMPDRLWTKDLQQLQSLGEGQLWQALHWALQAYEAEDEQGFVKANMKGFDPLSSWLAGSPEKDWRAGQLVLPGFTGQ